MRFALYDFLGRIKGYFFVTSENLGSTTDVQVRQPGHFEFVIDASGSMWGQLDEIKNFLVKMLVLEEFRNADVLVSVLSFASSGDLVTHASRVKISDFMAANSPALKAINSLTTRGCTCISQGFRGALDLIQPDEVTAVVLLSDGFANDRSPGAEKREIDFLVEKLKAQKNVFVNTISFGAWADFVLLSYVANACSGTCFQAPTAKEVYEVIHSTTALVAGATSPALDLALGSDDYQVFASMASRKVIGGSVKNLLIRGLRPEDDKVVYRYKRVEEATYNASSLPVCGENGTSLAPVLAFAKAQLADGNLNTAKYALVATRDQTLIAAHAKAMVNSEIATMAADVEDVTYNGIPATHTTSTTYGLPNANQPSVVKVLGILGDYASDIEVDMVALRSGYKKRGVKRIQGTRNPDGTVTPYPYKLVPRTPSQFLSVSSFDANRNNATVNMLVSEPCDHLTIADGTITREVEGVKLDLWAPRNYTLVGDGVLNVERLFVRIGNKRLFRALVAEGVLPDTTFDPKATYEIVLAGRPLIAYDATFDAGMFNDVFDTVARMKVLSSILAASMKGQSDTYTADQLAALKAIGVTGSMNFSAPTTTEYADLNQALADGIIDTRLSYKVDFGTGSMINLGELYSANEYLARRFTVAINGTEEKKPKFEMRWDAEIKYGIKALSARTVLNSVDDLMYPIFLDFLGLQATGTVAGILTLVGWDAGQITNFYNAAAGKVSKDTAVEVFTDARKALDKAIDAIFEKSISPLVFFVGSTGLMPDEFNARAMTAEQIKEKHPALTLGKNADEGTYYDVNGTVLSVTVKAEYFSTGKVPSTVTDDADAA